jgi:xylulokinase
MAAYIIGVDIGTQGTKAALFNERMDSLAEAFEASRLIQPEAGVVWQEADDIYGSVIRVIKELTAKAGAKGVKGAEIAAIGVDSQMAGIMGIDTAGEASTYYDSWLDNRCGAYVNLMRERGGDRVTAITGGPVSFTHGPKILWWKTERPEAWKRTAKFVLPHGYVTGKICGLGAAEAVFDYTNCHFSGFADNLAKTWSEELLSLFDVPPDKMARIVSPFEVVGTTTGEFAALTGLVSGIPVAAGAGDTAASTFGAGLFGRDTLLDVAGTASVLCGTTDSFVPDVTHRTMTMMRSPEDGIWFPLAYINGGGLGIRWFRDTLSGAPPPSYRELEEEAGTIGPGSEGLVYIPHVAGRVLPANPALKGAFVGLDLRHTRGHLFRAVLEGIAYEYAFYLSVLRDLYPRHDFRRLSSIGGGSKSDLFLGIKADVLGLEGVSFLAGDTALVGSAVIAGYGAGVFSDCRAPIHATIRERRIIPWDRNRHESYKPALARYLRTLEAMGNLYRDTP